MKKTLILGSLVIVFGFILASPTQAAESTNDALTLRTLIHENVDYEATNIPGGAVINLTSTNPNWVEKLWEKYDSLPKTSKYIVDDQIFVGLYKIDGGIQFETYAINPESTNYENLEEKIQKRAANPKANFYRIMKTRLFLKNHFQSWL